MAALKNIKRELFAQCIAKGVSASQAYEKSGYKPSRANAATLAHSQDVLKRVAELLERQEKIETRATEKAIAAVGIDKEWVMAAMIENAAIALGRKKVPITKTLKDGTEIEVEVTMRDAAAANRSLELLGREFKMWIERKEVGEAGDFERMDGQALRDFIAAEIGALGVGANGTAEAGNSSDPSGSRRLN